MKTYISWQLQNIMKEEAVKKKWQVCLSAAKTLMSSKGKEIYWKCLGNNAEKTLLWTIFNFERSKILLKAVFYSLKTFPIVPVSFCCFSLVCPPIISLAASCSSSLPTSLHAYHSPLPVAATFCSWRCQTHKIMAEISKWYTSKFHRFEDRDLKTIISPPPVRFFCKVRGCLRFVEDDPPIRMWPPLCKWFDLYSGHVQN